MRNENNTDVVEWLRYHRCVNVPEKKESTISTVAREEQLLIGFVLNQWSSDSSVRLQDFEPLFESLVVQGFLHGHSFWAVARNKYIFVTCKLVSFSTLVVLRANGTTC